MADVGRNDLVVSETAVLARVGIVAGLGQVARRESAAVEDNECTPVEQRQADLERRRVERHEHLGRVARSRDRAATEVDLVGRYAERRAHGRPDFCRVIGEGSEVGAGKRRRNGELRPHKLDPVSGIARQTDDDGVYVSISAHKLRSIQTEAKCWV